jgi:hypothetical protein
VFSIRASRSNDYLAFVPDGDGTEAYPKDPYTNDILLPAVCTNPRGYFLDPSGGFRLPLLRLEVVYTEATDLLVKVHISSLVTGP